MICGWDKRVSLSVFIFFNCLMPQPTNEVCWAFIERCEPCVVAVVIVTEMSDLNNSKLVKDRLSDPMGKYMETIDWLSNGATRPF